VPATPRTTPAFAGRAADPKAGVTARRYHKPAARSVSIAPGTTMTSETRYLALFTVGTLLGMLALVQALRRALEPRGEAPNTAGRMVLVGETLATFLVGAAVVKHNVRRESLGDDVLWTAAFAAAGVAMVEVVGRLSLRALLRSRLRAELREDNVSAGLAAASHLVAVGLLAARAVAGHGLQELGLALVFFAVAVVTHGLFVALFRALTTYDDAEAITGENLAAGVSYAGLTVSVAVLVARAVEGEFTGWWSSVAGFAGVAAWCLALYPVRQIVVGGLLLGARPVLRGGPLDEAIGGARDVGVAALEAASYLGAALAIASVA
jgi:uncharacterized membrane protein YjfL (UPF0719 family)